jgi:hypothetical protein
MSYEVLKSGRMLERKIPLRRTAEDGPEGKKNGTSTSSSSAEPKPTPLPTLPTSGETTEQPPITEPSKPATPTETAELIPSPEASKGKSKSKKKSKKTKAGIADKPLTSAPTSVGSIPFPSMSKSSSRKVRPVVPAAKPDPPTHDASPSPDDDDEKVGIKRTYAFNHQSHPEIFWTSAWGEKPSPAETPVEDHSQPAIGKQKGKMPSDKASQGRRPVSGRSHSPIRVPSSSSAMRAVKQLASVKHGKKRAREEVDAEVEEERPNQRRRPGVSGDADSPKGLSHRFSGLKKAVMNIAETAFTK